MNMHPTMNRERPRDASSPQTVAAAADSIPLLEVGTLVGWVICLAVGVIGLTVPYARPAAKPAEPPAVVAQMVEVKLTPEAPPPPGPAVPRPAEALPAPPPLRQAFRAPEAPPLLAVASPAPQIAFAVPAMTPLAVVDFDQAQFAGTASAAPADGQTNAGAMAPGPAAPAAAPVVERLQHGVGVGRQPMTYPRAAANLGQEGTVVVRFSVDPGGRVAEARVVAPSPWPVLNTSAASQIRQQWRFPPGPVRLYEVPIQFQLKKNL